MIKNKNNNDDTEAFLNYNDVKTKTVNWCTKMRNVNLLTPDQYNKCISSFANVNSGIIPKSVDMPSSGMPINYSLYNTRQESLTPDISGENTNTIMLVTNTGEYMACNSSNNLYYLKNINDPNINQNELYFILLPQNNDVYSIMSAYGTYLLANTSWGADFTGTTIGTMSSWNISKVNDSITIESVQYKDYFLSFTDKDSPLQIIYGKDESIQWKIIPKSQTNVNDKYGEYKGEDYISQQITILTNIKNSLIDTISLNVQKSELTRLLNKIRSNYDAIAQYMQDKLQYSKNLYDLSQANSKTGSSVTSKGLKLSNTEIGNIVITITNMKIYYVNLINLELNNIDVQLNNINTQDDYDQYDNFISDIEKQVNISKHNINQNQTILSRQKDTYSQIYNDEIYVQNKIDSYEKLDKQLKVNLDIATGNSNQSLLLVKIYPFVIIILLLIIIYLSYLTVIKFKNYLYGPSTL